MIGMPLPGSNRFALTEYPRDPSESGTMVTLSPLMLEGKAMAPLRILVLTLSIFLLSNSPCHADTKTDDLAVESFASALVCPGASVAGFRDGSEINFSQVCAVLRVVKNTIAHLVDKLDSPDTPLQSVTIKLKAAAVRTSGIKLNLIILKIGTKQKVDSVQDLTIKLVPKKETKAMLALKRRYFSERLADSILAAFAAVKTSGLDLKTDRVIMSVQFGVSGGVGGGIDSIGLAPISISISGEYESSTTQQIVFEFGKKKTSAVKN